MKEYHTLALLKGENGVATLTLTRPEKHNAINAQLIGEMRVAVAELAADQRVRTVVLAAEGVTFCAGGDLIWMREQAAKDRAGRIAAATELAGMLRDLDTLPKPRIGRVQGPAYGGGVGLMAVCDIVVSIEEAKFALTEVRLGLIPATVAPYVIRRIGEGAARRLFLNATPFDAREAMRYGLVSKVVAAAELDAAIAEETRAVLQSAPGAVAEAKAVCQRLARDPGADFLDWTAHRLADRWESDEAHERLAGFLARGKRPA
jgi:methylglutaconyl-CoA hydratase